jgi:hypothetical protein
VKSANARPSRGAAASSGSSASSTAATLDFPLDFLGRGKFQMIQLGDAPDRGDAWQREEKVVTAKDHVKLSLRPSGGCVIELKPQK